MGSQGIIGQAVALVQQLQIGFAGFEEHLDVPTLAVQTNDLLFGQAGISRQINNNIIVEGTFENNNYIDNSNCYIY